MRPKRIQRRRTKGWRMPPNTAYVGRPTQYGNLYDSTVHSWGGVEGIGAGHAVGWYAWWLANTEAGRLILARARRELAGKNLACWCALSHPCHADVLLLAVNGDDAPRKDTR